MLAARGRLARSGGARAAGAADAGRPPVDRAGGATSPVSGWSSATSATSSPDPDLFPEFNENLREALQRETELFVEHIIREDRSVLELLTADYTFVNERLARHYGIPDVYGSHFRRVAAHRRTARGLLGHGSILTVTAYPNRTSPVLRGKWLLDNFLGAPPPPPPPTCDRP